MFCSLRVQPRKLGQAITFLNCNREVHCSKLGRNTAYPECCFSSVSTVILQTKALIAQTDGDRFLTHNFQRILFFYSTVTTYVIVYADDTLFKKAQFCE
jgi:hypothetical protein